MFCVHKNLVHSEDMIKLFDCFLAGHVLFVIYIFVCLCVLRFDCVVLTGSDYGAEFGRTQSDL